MTRRVLALASAVTLAVAFSACGTTVPSSGPSSSPSGGLLPPDMSPAIQPSDLRYTCGSFPFDAGLLSAGPGDAEQANDPAAAVLRAVLVGEGPDFDFLPDVGWHLTGMDADRAEFVTVGGDRRLFVVLLQNSIEGWQVTNYGDCQARVVLAQGLGAADWVFDPAQPKPDASTQVFDALVTELSCNSGQPADGRVVGPKFVKSADRVLVIFAVRPRPGGHDCPSNPPTRVKVDLGEPLGERKLLDGGRLPPGDPAQPQS